MITSVVTKDDLKTPSESTPTTQVPKDDIVSPETYDDYVHPEDEVHSIDSALQYVSLKDDTELSYPKENIAPLVTTDEPNLE